ncbi:F0F1 ATP synthase subunit gamma [Buchnera aphidicola (Mindarus keteleerifoliae)]|uniref:F0F1 ATP synthase subunit gamma n=1 Tax=Buchnera aphidicola TaxID=9 RepID=UPI0031B6846F
MACKNEIRQKIDSIKNTKKITQAMQMVSFAKMKKSKEKMYASRPYLRILSQIINNILESSLEYQHSYFSDRKTRNIGWIIVSTDRGLCGSLNTNLFKKILIKMKKYSDRKIFSNICIFGSKALSFFKFFNEKIISKIINLEEKSINVQFIEPLKRMLQEYQEGKIDKLYLAFNLFKNSMFQIPTVLKLLPLNFKKNNNQKISKWDYLYEPDPMFLLNILLDRYIEFQVYQAILENIASEQAARMLAMKTATENSDDLINELQLLYNKVRQSSITQELTEIISGASSVSLN